MPQVVYVEGVEERHAAQSTDLGSTCFAYLYSVGYEQDTRPMSRAVLDCA